MNPYDYRTRAERLYDDHADAHAEGNCFEDCLICEEEEVMRERVEVKRRQQRLGPGWRRDGEPK